MHVDVAKGSKRGEMRNWLIKSQRERKLSSYKIECHYWTDLLVEQQLDSGHYTAEYLVQLYNVLVFYVLLLRIAHPDYIKEKRAARKIGCVIDRQGTWSDCTLQL